MKKDANE